MYYNIYIYIYFLSSSVVEQSAVNRLAVGSSPTWGVKNILKYKIVLEFVNKAVIP